MQANVGNTSGCGCIPFSRHSAFVLSVDPPFLSSVSLGYGLATLFVIGIPGASRVARDTAAFATHGAGGSPSCHGLSLFLQCFLGQLFITSDHAKAIIAR